VSTRVLVVMKAIVVAVLAMAVGCTMGDMDDGEPRAPSKALGFAPSPEASRTPAGKSVELTYYWVAERPAGDPDDVRINDCDGALLTWASHDFHAAVEMERTARATSPSGAKITFNDVGGCFRVLDAKYPWGIGVTSKTEGAYPLVPFRSIAVDPTVFVIGRWYYVPELAGKKTPSPSVFTHDGCVRAVDVGGAIKGAHIDFFVGDESARASFELDAVTLEEAGTRCGA
jgi:3D (Asp-Asp-Asp) domain-containing protein